MPIGSDHRHQRVCRFRTHGILPVGRRHEVHFGKLKALQAETREHIEDGRVEVSVLRIIFVERRKSRLSEFPDLQRFSIRRCTANVTDVSSVRPLSARSLPSERSLSGKGRSKEQSSRL